MTATLTPFARTVAAVGPIEDGIVTNTATALAATYPGVVEGAPVPRPVRPLVVRVAEEEARLDRRRTDLSRARRALARMDALAAELGAPDRAGARLRHRDATRANARMDAGLARYVRARDRVEMARARVTLAEARLGRLRAELEASTLPRDAELEQALNITTRGAEA